MSVVGGEGLGYNIQSFQRPPDKPVFTEVKATRYVGRHAQLKPDVYGGLSSVGSA